VLFVKDATAEGANFAVVRDTSSVAGQWNQWFYADAPLRLDGLVVRMTGQADVDLDLWLANGRAGELPRMNAVEAKVELDREPGRPDGMLDNQPPEDAVALEDPAELSVLLKARKATMVCFTGGAGGTGSRQPLAQLGLSLPVNADQAVMALFYPRLRSEKPPVFTELAGGRGVKVESDHGTDYVFLNPEPFQHADAEVRFAGTAGAIRVRGNAVTLSLGAAGEIACGGHSLKADRAESKDF